MNEYKVRTNTYAPVAHPIHEVLREIEMRCKLAGSSGQTKIITFEPQHITGGGNRRYDIEFRIEAGDKLGAKALVEWITSPWVVDQTYVRDVEKIVTWPTEIKWESTPGTQMHRYFVGGSGLLKNFTWNSPALHEYFKERIQKRSGDIQQHTLFHDSDSWKRWTMTASVIAPSHAHARAQFDDAFNTDIWSEFMVIDCVKDPTFNAVPFGTGGIMFTGPKPKVIFNLLVDVEVSRPPGYVELRAAQLCEDCISIVVWEILGTDYNPADNETEINLLVKYATASLEVAIDAVAEAISEEKYVIAWDIQEDPSTRQATLEEAKALLKTLSMQKLFDIGDAFGFDFSGFYGSQRRSVFEWILDGKIGSPVQAQELADRICNTTPCAPGWFFKLKNDMELHILSGPGPAGITAELDGGPATITWDTVEDFYTFIGKVGVRKSVFESL